MRRNNIMAFLFSILLLLSAFPANIAAAQPPAVVYTEFVSGNFNHAGDGTPASPYNLFEDAMGSGSGRRNDLYFGRRRFY